MPNAGVGEGLGSKTDSCVFLKSFCSLFYSQIPAEANSTCWVGREKKKKKVQRGTDNGQREITLLVPAKQASKYSPGCRSFQLSEQRAKKARGMQAFALKTPEPNRAAN